MISEHRGPRIKNPNVFKKKMWYYDDFLISVDYRQCCSHDNSRVGDPTMSPHTISESIKTAGMFFKAWVRATVTASNQTWIWDCVSASLAKQLVRRDQVEYFTQMCEMTALRWVIRRALQWLVNSCKCGAKTHKSSLGNGTHSWWPVYMSSAWSGEASKDPFCDGITVLMSILLKGARGPERNKKHGSKEETKAKRTSHLWHLSNASQHRNFLGDTGFNLLPSARRTNNLPLGGACWAIFFIERVHGRRLCRDAWRSLLNIVASESQLFHDQSRHRVIWVGTTQRANLTWDLQGGAQCRATELVHFQSDDVFQSLWWIHQDLCDSGPAWFASRFDDRFP